jgi:hypothetical protein
VGDEKSTSIAIDGPAVVYIEITCAYCDEQITINSLKIEHFEKQYEPSKEREHVIGYLHKALRLSTITVPQCTPDQAFMCPTCSQIINSEGTILNKTHLREY